MSFGAVLERRVRVTRLKLIWGLLRPQRPHGSVGALLTLLVAQIIYTLFVRSKHGTLAPTFENLTDFGFAPYIIGQVVQELILPVVLVFLLSASAPFKRLAQRSAGRRDLWVLFCVFALAQTLFLGYTYTLESREIGQFTQGGLLVLMVGYLCGWRMGLGLGILTQLLIGLKNYALWGDGSGIWDIFYWHVLVSREGYAFIWLGLSAGLVGLIFGAERFVPFKALLVGLVLGAAERYFLALGQYDPSYTVVPLIPITLMTGVALAGLALIIRNVQVAASLQQAQIAQLALTQAELKALRSQINPHFLFNSLNTIRYFVRTDPSTARRLLLSLSEVFQKALRSGELVALRDELSYVEAYLELEQARLGGRLTVHWQLPNAKLLETPVPTLILQPIVENAVIHGISKRTQGGQVSIRIEKWDDHLTLEVRDDGDGFDAETLKKQLESGTSQPKPDGREPIGLLNINHRLKLLYGPDHRLRIESNKDGTRVQLRIPLALHLTNQQGSTPTSLVLEA